MPRDKQFQYGVSLDEQGLVYAEGEAPVEFPPEWKPEHLLLAAVARCTLKSLRFYAREARVDGSARVRGLVTRGDADGRFGLTAAAIDLDVRIDPEPDAAQLAKLLDLAELGCFVGNSLAVRPTYRWLVNGQAAPPGR
jgi:organic hydroperoxide reductase OsmC/OhrA